MKIQKIHIYRYRNIPVSLHITIEPSLFLYFYMGMLYPAVAVRSIYIYILEVCMGGGEEREG